MFAFLIHFMKKIIKIYLINMNAETLKKLINK